MLEEMQKEKLRTKTVEALLEARALYLATSQANVLKHWELLQTRMRSAARTCASPEEWWTSLLRKLQITSQGRSGSRACLDLVHAVTELNARDEWLDLLEREHGYLMAMCRLISEQRKEAKNADQKV